MALLTNILMFLQLSLLLCTYATVVAVENVGSTLAIYPPAGAPRPLDHEHHHHHHHHHNHQTTPSPSHSPVVPPTQPPVKSPAHSPSYPPVKSPSSHAATPRNFLAVQGVVYCKSCKYIGVDTLMGAAPLAGAVVKLQCNNTKYHLMEQAKTDKNGFFFFMPQKVTTAGSHKCKVFLVSSPLSTCGVPTNLQGGTSGAILKPTPKPPATTNPDKTRPFELFTVGPLAFEPLKKLPCH